MPVYQVVFLIFLIIESGLTQAGLPETIAAINAILSQPGRKVAILVIDMQVAYQYSFYPDEFELKIPAQFHLLFDYIDNDKVNFVNVIYENNGETLPELFEVIKMKNEFKTVVKEKKDAFKSIVIYDRNNPKDIVDMNLATYLRGQEVTDIVPVGCFHTSCILETAIGAEKNGFHVIVDPDMNMRFNKTSATRKGMGEEWHQANEEKLWAEALQEHPNIQLVEKTKKALPCKETTN